MVQVRPSKEIDRMAKKLGLLDRLEHLDPRMVNWILLIMVVVVNIRPLGLPLKIGDETRTFYSTIENLPVESVVIFGTDSPVDSLGAQIIAMEPIFKHLMSKPVKVMIVTFREPSSAVIADRLVEKLGAGGKKYGVDYVNLGYAAGNEAAVTKFAQDIHEVFKRDYYGNNMETLPMMKDIRSYKDVSIIVDVSDHNVAGFYLRYYATPYKTPLLVASSAMVYIQELPYLRSRQYTSLISSQRGGAEYEKLISWLGSGARIMDSQSTAALVVLLLMIMGNCIFLYKKYGKRLT